MVEVFKKLIKRPKTKEKISYNHELFQIDFWGNTHNQWLKGDRYVERNLRDLFNMLDQSALDYFQQHPLVFIPSTGELSCALSGISGIDVIIVFPELIKMLRSAAPRRGLAIVAHELGHLISQHSEREIDRLQAQIEADRFATQLGLGLELQEILLQFDEIDCRVRITYIASAMANEMQKESKPAVAFH
jgi:hypothetical protein